MKTNTQKTKTPMIAISALVVLVLAAGVYAFAGMGKNSDAQAAMDSGNYQAFVSAVESAKKANIPTEAQFNTMVEHHKAMQEFQSAVETAIDNNDYAAWKAAMENRPQPKAIEDLITTENFPTYVKMQNALKDGDVKTAQTLADELGISPGMGSGFGKGQGRGESMGRGKGMRQGQGQMAQEDCPLVQ
jgi:hypothetical protein